MSDRTPPSLTPRQHDVLTEIVRLEAAGEAVTTARIGERLGMPRQNVRSYLLALQGLNLILYVAGERQNAVIRLTAGGATLAGQGGGPATNGPNRESASLGFPILGDVAAGQPGWAEEHIEGYAARLQDVLDLHEGDFLLRVRGDSMTGVGIYPATWSPSIRPTTNLTAARSPWSASPVTTPPL